MHRTQSLLQTEEWAGLKETQGWQSFNIEGVYVLKKQLPLGLSFLYAPEVTWEQAQRSQVIASMAKQSELSLRADVKQSIRSPRPDGARDDGVSFPKKGILFFRLEILDKNRPEIIEKLKSVGFIKAFEELQPEWRQIIDISKTEEEILNQMKPKGRYNIKVAQKHGVGISKIENRKSKIDIFYNLYRETTKYQKISIRDKKYFFDMMEALSPKNEIEIIIAGYQGRPLSAILVTFYDGVASYLYGGTSREHKNVMAPYVAHWEAILEAKRRGCTKYDLLAVAPSVIASDSEAIFRSPRPDGARDDNISHKYDNLTRFKTQFGGKTVNLVGSYDYVYKPIWYKIFKAAEKFRRKS